MTGNGTADKKWNNEIRNRTTNLKWNSKSEMEQQTSLTSSQEIVTSTKSNKQ